MTDATSTELSHAEWAHTCQQRAGVYAWFSTLYAAELSEATLNRYLAGEAATLLASLSAIGLDSEGQRLQAAVESLRGIAFGHLDLAADFAQAFLLDAKTGALPYASSYDAGESSFFGPSEQRMREFLTNSSLTLQEDFKEPADHLAIYLAAMAKFLEQAGGNSPATQAVDQAAFLQDALMGWLPAFVEKCQTLSTRFDFYPALAALLLAFVRQDLAFLEDIATQKASH